MVSYVPVTLDPRTRNLRWFMSLRFLSTCFIVFLLTTATQAQKPCPAPSKGTLRLATGPKGGGYAAVGEFLRELALRGDLRKHGIDRIELQETAGTDENLKLLESCSVELGLAQSDLFHEAVKGHGIDHLGEGSKGLTPRGHPLYAEFIQILVPPHSAIHKVKDLSQKKVLTGLNNSGTAHTAEIILSTADAERGQKESSEMAGSTEGVKRAFNEGYKAVFFSTAVPNTIIKQLTSTEKKSGGDPEYRLISLDNELIRELISEGAYIAASIPSDRYWKQSWWMVGNRDEPAPPEDIATVAVEALLVSRVGFDSQASSIVAALKKHRTEFKKTKNLELDLIVPFVEKPSTFWFLAFLIVVYGCLHVAVAKYRRTLRLHQEIFVVFAFFISIWLLAAAGLWFFEHRYNPYFETYAKSCWSMLSFVAGRFEGRMPMTPQGEFLSLISVIFGVGLVAWFTAELSGRLVKGELGVVSRMLERRNSMLHQLKDHLVVFNWDERVPLIVRQMGHSTPGAVSPPCVLISPIPVQIPAELSDSVIPLVGNAVEPDVLTKAGILHCRSVMILSAWRTSDPNERRRLDADAADTKTMMTIMAIRNLERKDGRPVRITAEIREPRNLSSAQSCSGEHCQTELLCLQEFGTDMLAACAASPGLGAVYAGLLNSPDGKTAIVQSPVPGDLIGAYFSDALRRYAHPEAFVSGRPVIPIGIFRDSRLYIGPDDSELGVLLPGDRLFLIGGHGHNKSVRVPHVSRKSA
jgi:TRAP transporter TAXI family solute receptor